LPPASDRPALPVAATAPAPAVKALPAEPPPVPGALQLLTAAEAALPASAQVGLAGVSVDDGPTIVIDRPSDGATVANGFPLYILYEAVGRETIDTATVKLICRKQPQVNLTARIKPYIGEKGIWIEHVRMPPGHYRLRLSLADTKGRTAEREFSLTVTGQAHR
jgi:hypothetical protein